MSGGGNNRRYRIANNNSHSRNAEEEACARELLELQQQQQQQFQIKLEDPLVDLNENGVVAFCSSPGNCNQGSLAERGRLSTVDLLVQTSLHQLFFLRKILSIFF